MEEASRKWTKTGKILKFAFLLFFVLTVGGAGGILTDRFALPYLLVKFPELNRYEFLKRVNEHTTVIETTKEINISEDKAAVDAIKKVLPSVVQVSTPTEKDDEFEYKGGGIILTSDGLIITSIKNIAGNETEEAAKKDSGKNKAASKVKTPKVKLANGNIYIAKLAAEDSFSGLAIVKIEETDLPVIAFGLDDLELGEKAIAVSDSVKMDIVSKIINNYPSPEEAQKSSENKTNPVLRKRIKISSELDEFFNGAPVINTSGEIIGISEGQDLFIPASEVKKFADDSMK